MTQVPYHAWTHRPKAQGGTDPIAFAAGSIPFGSISGMTIEVGSPFSYDDFLDLESFGFATNDATVFSHDASETGAGGLAITPGVYHIETSSELSGLDIADYPDSMMLIATAGISGPGGITPLPRYTLFYKTGEDPPGPQPPFSSVVTLFSVATTLRAYLQTSTGSGTWTLGFQLNAFRLGDSP